MVMGTVEATRALKEVRIEAITAKTSTKTKA